MISAIVHVVVLVALGLLIGRAPRGSAERPTRTVGIVLVQQVGGERQYFDADENTNLDENTTSETESIGDASAQPSDADSPLDPSEALPDAPLLGPGTLEDGGIGDAGDSTAGGAPPKRIDGKTTTSVFGVEGEGSKFVYVFDRSGSMSFPAGRPLAAAKSELNASLNSLDRIHQFQIIFFNHAEPRIFNPTGRKNALVFASDVNRQAAGRFVASITADGGTHPEAALALAVKMRPDVIFFLTDGEDLDFAMIDRITRINRGASINAIQFGSAAKASNRLLVELARRNGGSYVYVNTSRFAAGR